MDVGKIMDVSVQTDAARKQNSYIAPTLPKAIELLDNAGPGKYHIAGNL